MSVAEKPTDARLPWYRYIGPWPIRPWISFWALAFYYLSLASGVSQYGNAQAQAQIIPKNIYTSVLSAVVVALALWLMGKWSATSKNLGAFLGVCVVAAGWGVFFRWWMGFLSTNALDNPPFLVAAGFTRTVLLLVIIQSIAGLVTRRLSNQVRQTQEALAQSRDEQERMLLADEESRKQISGLLHDRVQAGLIASCLELQMLAMDRSPEEKQRITSIVERLENLRSMDVRSVARVLSPNLADVDLVTALDELATQYESVMTTRFTVNPKIDGLRDTMGERVLLGTYRIIEQGLLNAAGHGRARNCEVTVDLTTDKEIVISVRDDGVGFQGGPIRQGVGGALISTWTRSLEGSWDWNDDEEGGAILIARIPISSS
jgi:signal transduction histidine kinase